MQDLARFNDLLTSRQPNSQSPDQKDVVELVRKAGIRRWCGIPPVALDKMVADGSLAPSWRQNFQVQSRL